MLPRAAPPHTRPVSAVGAATPSLSGTDPRRDLSNRLTQVALGKELQVELLSKLHDGTFMARIAGAPARVALPVAARAGDTLSMILIARQPRPTFLLKSAEESATATLSGTGKLIDYLLRGAAGSGTRQALLGRAALTLPGTLPDAGQLTSALQQTLSGSGLFYESHLQQWVAGQRSLEEIRAEQQRMRTTAAQGHPDEIPEGGGLERDTEAAPRAGPESRPAMQRADHPDSFLDADVILRSDDAIPPVGAEKGQMISLQLQVHETHHVRWQGELRPGLPLEWEIIRDEQKPEQEHAEEAQQSWTSMVRFELPTLGNVKGTVTLLGDRMHIAVWAEREPAARALHQHGPELEASLAAAGTILQRFSVETL